MTTLNIDVHKVERMSMDALKLYSDSGAHPAEVIIALAQATGRVIASMSPQGEIVQRELLDLAVKQFRDAAGETSVMDATKKDILYRLGIVLEKMGKRDEYLECMKQIYEVDYGYQDVAKRVESSYTA